MNLTFSRCHLPASKASLEAKPAFSKAELLDGHWYEGISQRAKFAYWNKAKQRFMYMLEVHGILFVEEICHPENDKYYDTFCPMSRIPYGRLPKDVVEAGHAQHVYKFTKPSFEVKKAPHGIGVYS